jgi:hypothetical protein
MKIGSDVHFFVAFVLFVVNQMCRSGAAALRVRMHAKTQRGTLVRVFRVAESDAPQGFSQRQLIRTVMAFFVKCTRSLPCTAIFAQECRVCFFL